MYSRGKCWVKFGRFNFKVFLIFQRERRAGNNGNSPSPPPKLPYFHSSLYSLFSPAALGRYRRRYDTADDTADPSLAHGGPCPPGARLCSGMRNLHQAALKFPVGIRNLSGPSWTSLTELEIWSWQVRRGAWSPGGWWSLRGSGNPCPQRWYVQLAPLGGDRWFGNVHGCD